MNRWWNSVMFFPIFLMPSFVNGHEKKECAGYMLNVDGYSLKIPSELVLSVNESISGSSLVFQRITSKEFNSISVSKKDEFNSVVSSSLYSVSKIKSCSEVEIYLIKLKDGRAVGLNDSYAMLTESKLIMLSLNDSWLLESIFQEFCPDKNLKNEKD